jgi:hypothetical protein
MIDRHFIKAHSSKIGKFIIYNNEMNPRCLFPTSTPIGRMAHPD